MQKTWSKNGCKITFDFGQVVYIFNTFKTIISVTYGFVTSFSFKVAS